MTTTKFAVYSPRAMHGDGGVTNALWLWAESLRRTGARVTVLYDKRLPVSPARRVPHGVETRGLPHVGTGRRTVPTELTGHLDVDTILVLHSAYVPYNVIAGELARRNGIRYLVVPHGAFDPHVRKRHRAARSLWEAAERRLMQSASAVHVFFRAEAEHIRDVAPLARVAVSPTAVDVPDDEWTPRSRGGYVSWLGRYDVRHKGLDRLLDAMASLPANQRPELRMHGRDHRNTRRQVQAMVAERDLGAHVVVGGPVDGEEKRRFLLAAGAYVHPARWESFGVALAENLALGVPCLTTSDVNMAESLHSAGAALVVDGDVSSLAAGLAAAHAGELVDFGPRGRAFVSSELSHDVVGRRLCAELDAVLSSGAWA